MREYVTSIGLEIHAELDTETKAFCACRNEFGALPNTLVCPVCLGLPGALPRVNKKAVEYTIMAGLVLGSKINNLAVFERKNYFYPDLSKSYQVSQLGQPICLGGGIKLKNGEMKRFNRIHLEEDAGKLIHDYESDRTYIDFNRSGAPLIEMVTEPDFENADEVVEFLNTLRQTLINIGVAKCRMEEGGFRIDVNISVKEKDSESLGTRVELKNINSFKTISKVIEFEKNRQIEILEGGNEVLQETRSFDEKELKTNVLRKKEDENDYRYFPDPSILPIEIRQKDIEKIRAKIPESIEEKYERLKAYGIGDEEIDILISKGLANYFESICKIYPSPQEISNWLISDFLKLLKEIDMETLIDMLPSKEFAEIIKLVDNDTITRVNGKNLMAEVINSGKSVKQLLIEMDLTGDVNKQDVVLLMGDIISNNPNIKKDYKESPEKVMNFCIGQIMKSTNGKAKAEYLVPLIDNILK